MEMTEDYYDKIAKVLEFYMRINKEVHVKIIAGADCGCFRNGYIISVDSGKRNFIIVDRVLGNKTYSFYEIDENVQPFKEVGK